MIKKDQTHQLVDHLFRHQHGKMVAILTRIFGINHLELIEDVVQDTFHRALSTWKFQPPPQNPSAWLMKVARNRAIDIFRKKKREFSVLDNRVLTADRITEFFHEKEISDSQLRLIFTCCHPLLSKPNQIAFTLKAISGFSIKEIAQALLSTEETIKKRLNRARKQILEKQIKFEIPVGKSLLNRIDTVLKVLYLLFNEGYQSSKKGEIIRKDLCVEAMRLCKLLDEHSYIESGDTKAMLALMCFHAARFESRVSTNYEIILLPDQDRKKWNKELINIGNDYLNKSIDYDRYSVYHVEAAIAAEHCMAESFETTRWDKLQFLYKMLYQASPSAIILVNKIVVDLQLGNVNLALDQIMSLKPIELGDRKYLYHSVFSEIYKKLGDHPMQRHQLSLALESVPTIAEKNIIYKKLEMIP